MVVAFDEAHNTLNTLKGLRTDNTFSELFARVQIIADAFGNCVNILGFIAIMNSGSSNILL
jgi:hypothetical protein